MSSIVERSVMPSFYFGPESVGMTSWQDWFLVLGFGEEEAREIEKRKERQGSLFWRKKEMAGVCVLEEGGLFCIYRVLEKVFFAFMFIYFFLCLCFFFFFINIALTWKTVGASKASVLYIYIDEELTVTINFSWILGHFNNEKYEFFFFEVTFKWGPNSNRRKGVYLLPFISKNSNRTKGVQRVKWCWA